MSKKSFASGENIIKNKIALINGQVYFPEKNKLIKSNIVIEEGILKDVDYKGELNDFNAVDCKGKVISPGFLDLRSHFGEPGFEDKETLLTGSEAALSGGYTKVCMLPNTSPALDNPEIVESLNSKSESISVNIYPIGSITKGMQGSELSEIALMFEKGIVAISDGVNCLQNSQLMRNALEYAKMFNIPVINHAEDIYLKNNGMANESFFSTKKGFPANPAISESVIIYRDLEIASFIGGRLHIPHISTKESVELVKRYKNRGLNITAEVSPHHIGLSEEDLGSYNSQFKIAPPLRSKEDRLSLIQGLKEGVIDCISSDHCPHRLEDKETDILSAKSGVISLESAFPYVYNILSKNNFSIENILKLFTINPSKVIDIDWIPLQIGKFADLNIFDPKIEWTFKSSDIYSKSQNSALFGRSMRGKIEKIIHNGTLYKFD